MTADSSYWNYRVMRHEKDGETWVSIHEVYYKENKPVAFTVDATDMFADDIDGLNTTLRRMVEALDKPVLTPEDFSYALKDK